MIRLFLLISVFISLEADGKIPNLKVLLKKSARVVEVSGLDLKRTLLTIKGTKQHTGHKIIRFNCDHKSKKRGRKYQLLAVVSSPSGSITWNGERYRGKILISESIKKLNCDVINEVPLEVYLSSLLSKEMNSSWPSEALKAQAVAARSYALFKRKMKKDAFNYDLENSERNQVSGSLYDETGETLRLAYQTKGEVLVDHQDRIIPAFYHSKCGGRTLGPEKVWKTKVPGYRGVDCKFCENHGRKSWNITLPKVNFKVMVEKKLKVKNIGGQKTWSKILLAPDRFENDYLRVFVGKKREFLKKAMLRDFWGRKSFPSNNFKVVNLGDILSVKGKGNGHGVGMCQFGALDMADKGMTYREILKHYFPNFRIKRIY